MNRSIQIVRRFYDFLLDLCFPPCCVVCGKVETWLCEPCARQIPFADRPICPRCGDGWSGAGLCPRCRTTPLHVAPIRSAFLFEGALRDAIHAFKYRGGRAVAAPLAMRMAEAWERDQLCGDILMPVPLHAERVARRGYNQAALLARALASEIKVPMREDILVRTRPTLSQTRLGRGERRKNVQDAFACSNNWDLSGLHIVLIDDVATTGATLDACAVALLTHGARRVSAFTLAHAT